MTQSNLQSQCKPYRSPNEVFCRNRKTHPKIHLESQGFLNSQSQRDKPCTVPPYELLRVVAVGETERVQGDCQRLGRGAQGVGVEQGEFQMKSFGDGWW